MPDVRGFKRLFRLVTQRGDVRGDIDKELRFHLDMRTQDLIGRGVPPARAAAAARRMFGDVATVRSTCRHIGEQSRRAKHRGELVDNLRQDLAFAFRSMAKAPGFTAIAIATLGLGIGANTAIFSVVNSVLLRPLPYADADRIYRAWANDDDGSLDRFSFRKLEYSAFAEQGTSWEVVGGDFATDLTIVTEGVEPERVQAAFATPGYFDVFGIVPQLGRVFTQADIDEGNARVAVVTHGFWMRRLGGNPAAVGNPITTSGGTVLTVIGVLPATFQQVEGTAEIFFPYTVGTDRWIARWLYLYARLKPGVAPERAAEEMTALVRQIGETDRRSRGWNVTTESLHHLIVGDVEPAILALFGTVVLVLLIACANVANLFLARTTAREREIVVRLALGAGRGRIVRQVLVESVVLATIGGIVGTLMAVWGVQALIALAPSDLPRLDGVALNGGVLAFTLAVSVVAGIVFGLAPALHASRSTLSGSLRRQSQRVSTGQAGGRVLGALVVSEVALAIVLLVSAGLVMRSFAELRKVDVGFNQTNVLAIQLSPPSSKYRESHEIVSYYRQLEERIAGLSGVHSVGTGSNMPLAGQGPVASLISEDRWRAGERDAFTALQRTAGPNFFTVLQTPILSGRVFNDQDSEDAPRRLVLNETLARQVFPDGDAVGKRVAFGRNPGDNDWQEVIGVVGDVKYQEMANATQATLFQAHPQWTWRAFVLFVRTSNDSETMLSTVRNEIRAFDPDVPQYNVTTLTELFDNSVASPRFNSWLFALFGLVALILASAGIYGVLSFAVTQRHREIGIRMALGAHDTSVIRLVVRRGMTLVVAGAALGITGAVASTRLLQSLLFAVSPTDATTFVAVIALLSATALFACYLPARRASRVDPAVVLREE